MVLPKYHVIISYDSQYCLWYYQNNHVVISYDSQYCLWYYHNTMVLGYSSQYCRWYYHNTILYWVKNLNTLCGITIIPYCIGDSFAAGVTVLNTNPTLYHFMVIPPTVLGAVPQLIFLSVQGLY